MKILIIKVQTIGDTLLISPLIRNLYLNNNSATIDVVINEGTEDVLRFNKKVRNIYTYPRKKYRNLNKLKRIYKELRFIRLIQKEKYNVVIDLDQGDKGAILTMMSRAKVRIGSNRVKAKLAKNTYTNFLPEKFTKHMVDSNLDPLKILRFSIFDKKVEIYWDSKSENALNRKLGNIKQFIHIHPFSKLDLKELCSKSLIKIIDYCELCLNIKVVITSGNSSREINRVAEILSLCKSSPISLSAQLTLNEVSALNKRSVFFIGVDTALMHISAANNIPVFAFFGPTSPKIWGPWDNNLLYHSFMEYKKIQIVGIHRIYIDIDCYTKRGLDYSDRRMIKPDLDIVRQQIKEMLNENTYSQV